MKNMRLLFSEVNHLIFRTFVIQLANLDALYKNNFPCVEFNKV